MSRYDVRLVALSHLTGANNELSQAELDLQRAKRSLRLEGMEVSSITRVLDLLLSAAERVHAARCTLWDAVCDEMRSDRCA